MLAMAGADGHPAAVHDAVAVACLLWPDFFGFERGRLSVGVEDGPARGQTRFTPGDGRHIVLTSVQRDKLLDMMVARLLATGRRK